MTPIGYAFLIKHFDLKVLSPYKTSYLTSKQVRMKECFASGEIEYFPSRFKLEEKWQDHLRFAIKHEGINLNILKALFEKLDESELKALICEQRVSVILRRIWFFYEFLTGRRLEIPALKTGVYDYALPPEDYFTIDKEHATRAPRQRLFCNLPGNAAFCPIVHLTKKIKSALNTDFGAKISAVLSKYPNELIYRANAFLYLRETKSSFAIEQQTPSQQRTTVFMEVLKQAGTKELNTQALVQLQNCIVDARYAESGFRQDQVYVGQTLAPGHELVHFIGVKPNDLNSFMEAFFEILKRLTASSCNPVITAAVLSFAFVFIHPFDDGNGRLHRYLMHHILAMMKFSPENLIFPVSAVLYKNPTSYDRMLESFSKRLMPLINYELDTLGVMTVENETADFYRYINYTEIVELFFEIIEKTLETELVPELDYLKSWEQARTQMRNIVDMPEKKIRLFITFVQQNNGSFPKNRRKMFEELSDAEISSLTRVINKNILSRNSKK